MNNGIIVVLDAAICFAIVNISVYESANASDVSVTSVITSLVTDGIIFFTICGKIILKKVCVLLYPRTVQASY